MVGISFVVHTYVSTHTHTRCVLFIVSDVSHSKQWKRGKFFVLQESEECTTSNMPPLVGVLSPPLAWLNCFLSVSPGSPPDSAFMAWKKCLVQHTLSLTSSPSLSLSLPPSLSFQSSESHTPYKGFSYSMNAGNSFCLHYMFSLLITYSSS